MTSHPSIKQLSIAIITSSALCGPILASDWVKSHVDSLRIRAGHSTQHEVIGEATPDMRLEVLETSSDGRWHHIKTSSGIQGWVAAGYVKPSAQESQY